MDKSVAASRHVSGSMRVFPQELATLFGDRGLRLLYGKLPHINFRSTAGTPTAFFRGPISHVESERCIAVLNSQLYETLERKSCPIDLSTFGDGAKAGAAVTTSFCHRSAMLEGNSRAARKARQIGLLQMLKSESMFQLVRAVTGVQQVEHYSCQATCYEAGDYVGPHNDYFPDHPKLKHGYIDVHLMLASQDVASQTLVYEQDGYLSQSIDVAVHSGITVNRLPYWHQVTPLVPRKGRAETARRWVLLSTFAFKQK